MSDQKTPSLYSRSTLRNLIQKQKILLFGVILPLFTIIVALLIGLLFMQKDNSYTVPSVSFKNWLKPTAELRVGDFRYVSACQVLPLSSMAEIFGKINDQSKISEEAITVSVPKSEEDRSIHTSCGYKLTDNTYSDLKVEQHTNVNSLKDISSLVLVTDEDELSSLIKNLKQKAAKSNNKDAETLAARFEKSFATYHKYKAEFHSKELAKVNFNGLVLPTSRGEMQVAYNNVTYTLNAVKLDKASVEDLAKLNQALKVIATNGQNKNLDQSPAPTVLGDRDTIGNTKIVEPCAVISNAIFKTITGIEENDVIRRSTLPIKSNIASTDRDNKPIILSNSCSRNSRDGDSDASVDLQIYHAKTVADAQHYVKNYDDLSGSPRALETNADEAFEYSNNIDSDAPLYVFRVGPYVCALDIQTISSKSLADDIVSTSASREQYIAAINLLADSIKVNSAIVK